MTGAKFAKLITAQSGKYLVCWTANSATVSDTDWKYRDRVNHTLKS